MASEDKGKSEKMVIFERKGLTVSYQVMIDNLYVNEHLVLTC
jgi:hypothetical protein